MERKKNFSLNENLVIEILLRLPVRSLLRLKCVSKSWLSLISDSQFVKSHFDLAAAPTYRLLYDSLDYSTYDSIDPEASLVHNDEVSFKVPRTTSPTPREYVRWNMFVDSDRGFILLKQKISHIDFVYFLIWNPSIGLRKRIRHKRIMSGMMQGADAQLFGFGYDSSTDDYVIVSIILPRSSGRCIKIQCFSVKTNSWSHIIEDHSTPYCLLFSSPSSDQYYSGYPGLFLNGAIHWTGNNSHNGNRIIITFDVSERRLLEIPLPHDVAKATTSLFCLKYPRECLCIISASYLPEVPPMIEIWIMKKYKDQSSWTKLFVLSDGYYNCFPKFFPICFTTNGDILVSANSQTFVRLNDRGKVLDLRIRSQDEFSKFIMYRESLLSLPASHRSN